MGLVSWRFHGSNFMGIITHEIFHGIFMVVSFMAFSWWYLSWHFHGGIFHGIFMDPFFFYFMAFSWILFMGLGCFMVFDSDIMGYEMSNFHGIFMYTMP